MSLTNVGYVSGLVELSVGVLANRFQEAIPHFLLPGRLE
jgi:hypothetical protein